MGNDGLHGFENDVDYEEMVVDEPPPVADDLIAADAPSSPPDWSPPGSDPISWTSDEAAPWLGDDQEPVAPTTPPDLGAGGLETSPIELRPDLHEPTRPGLDSPLADVLRADQASGSWEVSLGPLDLAEPATGDQPTTDLQPPLTLSDDGAGVDLEPGADPWDQVPAPSGALSPGLLGSAFAALGAPWPPDGPEPVDGGTAEAVSLLDRAGADSYVAHGDLDDLRIHLDHGDPILVGGQDDTPMKLVAIDADDRTATLADPTSGDLESIPLATLERAWDDTAGQMVVAARDDASVVLLPVRLG